MKKKLLSLLLISCLLVSSMPLTVFAAEDSNVLNEITSIVIDGENYIFERTIDDEIVTAVVRTIEGEIVESATANHQTQKIATNGNVMSFDAAFDSISAKSTVDWGTWSTNDEVLNVKSKTLAGILVILAVAAPWVAVTKVLTIGSALVGMGADEVRIKIKIRYGESDEYYHYERITYFYGDNEFITSFSDAGKTSLD